MSAYTSGPGQLLNRDDAASILALSPRTVVDMARRGELPCVVLRRGRDGRASVVRFDPRELETWVEERRQPATLKRSMGPAR